MKSRFYSIFKAITSKFKFHGIFTTTIGWSINKYRFIIENSGNIGKNDKVVLGTILANN